ncbi:hypothetical protein MNB_SV-4-1067 [hydrothermal vent metagenome]|uniref:Methyltransferase domain-containing protein n=1 Tax=hydrothermal vent metagenome TaxID=652676 RepID=A0A1W1E8J6_9ZZZZ
MANTTDSLDLYAKVEDLLENQEAIASLYDYYYETLSQIAFESLLDVGCGSGAYLLSLKEHFPHIKAMGIDLSPVMADRARAKGVDAEAVDLCELEGTFDVITAVFDMMNYLPSKALDGFFGCIKAHLHDGGYFMFDINTLYGFENVAVGAYIVEDEHRFVAIDSDFEAGRYQADFTLFENENGCYRRTSQTIEQFYHTTERLVKASGMQLVADEPLSLYGFEESDKRFIVLRKV